MPRRNFECVARGVVTVVPVSSNVARVFPFQTLLPADATGLRVASKAQASTHLRLARVRNPTPTGVLQAVALSVDII